MGMPHCTCLGTHSGTWQRSPSLQAAGLDYNFSQFSNEITFAKKINIDILNNNFETALEFWWESAPNQKLLVHGHWAIMLQG